MAPPAMAMAEPRWSPAPPKKLEPSRLRPSRRQRSSRHSRQSRCRYDNTWRFCLALRRRDQSAMSQLLYWLRVAKSCPVDAGHVSVAREREITTGIRVVSPFVLISLREMDRHLAERDEYLRTETLPEFV